MVPVICVDGPSGSGKGTLSQRLAGHLGFHLLDSGALYRIVGFAALEQGIAWDDEASVTQIARDLECICHFRSRCSRYLLWQRCH